MNCEDTIKDIETSERENRGLTLEEKFRLAINEKPLFKLQPSNGNISSAPTQNNTISTLNSEKPEVTGEHVVLRKKIFRIKKYVKYNKFLNEICSDEEVSDSDKKKLGEPGAKKISPFSKVNFSKLKAEEKDERLKNLAKLVKRLRRKVRNLEHKVRFNATKLLNKHIWNKLGINTKNKYLQPEFNFDFDKIWKALRKVRDYEDFEYDDQKHLIENVINFVAEDKLKLDSLTYRRICSQIRLLMNKERVKYISKKQQKVTVSFPETEVNISNMEYAKIIKFKENEEVLRAVLGVYDQNEKAVKVITEEPKQEENKTYNLNGELNNLLFNSTNNSQNLFNSNLNNFNNMNNFNFNNNNNQQNVNFLGRMPQNNQNLQNNNNINPLTMYLLNSNPQFQNLFFKSFASYLSNNNNMQNNNLGVFSNNTSNLVNDNLNFNNNQLFNEKLMSSSPTQKPEIQNQNSNSSNKNIFIK